MCSCILALFFLFYFLLLTWNNFGLMPILYYLIKAGKLMIFVIRNFYWPFMWYLLLDEAFRKVMRNPFWNPVSVSGVYFELLSNYRETVLSGCLIRGAVNSSAAHLFFISFSFVSGRVMEVRQQRRDRKQVFLVARTLCESCSSSLCRLSLSLSLALSLQT